MTVVLPSPSAPMEVARELLGARYQHPDGVPDSMTLRHWRGGWWAWQKACWAEIEQRAMSAAAYAFTEHAGYVNKDGDRVPWAPNRRKIADLLDALAAVTHLPESVSMPSWLDGRAYDGALVSCTNGLLDVASTELLARASLSPMTPRRRNRGAGTGSSTISGARTAPRSTRCRSGSAT
jgi:putative DNA primase/helicase